MSPILLFCLVLLHYHPASPAHLFCPISCACSETDADKVVDCSNRGLTQVPGTADPDITEFILSDNSITVLGSRAFSRYTSLQKLDLANNEITTIHETAFSDLSSLAELNMSSNNISSVTTGTFDHIKQATYVNLRHNRLSVIPPLLFWEMTSLETLLLGYNDFTDEVFDVINTHIIWIKHLDLSGNRFDQIPYLFFNNMAFLMDISLSGSRVMQIDPNAFIGLRVLQFLDLSDNALLEIRREMFQSIPDISRLSLHDNPILCTCGTKQVQDWLKDSKASFQEEVDCTTKTGEVIRNIQFADLEFLCANSDVTVEPTATPPCGTNVTLTLDVLVSGSQSMTLKWSVSRDWYSVYHQMVVAYRKYGEPENEMFEQVLEQSETVELSGLSEGTQYVACLYDRDCMRRACTDFETSRGSPTGSPILDPCEDLPLALGMTSLGFCIILAVVIIFILLVRYNRCSCAAAASAKSLEHGDNEANHQTVLGLADVTTNSHAGRQLPDIPDIYESIPATILDANSEESFDKRNMKGATGSGTPTHPRYLKKPEKPAGKVEKSKRNSGKGEIASTSNTKVFRRSDSTDRPKSESPNITPKHSPLPKKKKVPTATLR